MDFMGPFPSSYGNSYIMVAVDYVSKWVETKATVTCEAKEVAKFLKSTIFSRAMWYKEKTKMWHGKNLWVKELQVGHKVLLYQSRLKLIPGKLKSKWTGPYTIIALRANRAVKLQGSDPNSAPFMVNGHRVKPFRENSKVRIVEEIPLRTLGVIA
ncbi:uncharacterized protein LOC121766869 [Salvia splendens]|uniref:uncharacterized protein LOC121766869 n=1 Tax=Salvia splendens TaxID=180675 RepID=UPI001C25C4A4|nr:uncharacterized protein LOC121766869 [Salvia splendens]